MIKKIIPHFLRKAIKRILFKPDFYLNKNVIRKLNSLPRCSHVHVKILNKYIEITDPYWFLHSFDELLVQQIYLFETTNLRPRIIDCGANIGLSIIFFKYLYPKSEIIAFEPDEEIFNVLQKNIVQYNYPDIVLHKKAVWNKVDTLYFVPDGSVGGRIISEPENMKTIKVKSIRLRDFLKQNIDLLKIDIEGSEYEVLVDCKDSLKYVDRIFIEYHGRYNEKQKLHDILQILKNANFRYHIKEANPVLHPFINKELNKLYDLQLNIFGFKQWK